MPKYRIGGLSNGLKTTLLAKQSKKNNDAGCKGQRLNLPKQQEAEKNIQNGRQERLTEFMKCTKNKYQIKQKHQKSQKLKQVV